MARRLQKRNELPNAVPVSRIFNWMWNEKKNSRHGELWLLQKN